MRQSTPMITLLAIWIVSACSAGAGPPSTGATQAPLAASVEPASTPTAAATASSTAEPPAIGTATLTTEGCSFAAAPGATSAGMVALELVNESGSQFDADLWMLNAGHNYEELTAHIAEEQRRMDAGERGLGHPTFAKLVAEASVAAEGGTLTSRLDAGTYGIACILVQSDGPERLWAAGPFTIID